MAVEEECKDQQSGNFDSAASLIFYLQIDSLRIHFTSFFIEISQLSGSGSYLLWRIPLTRVSVALLNLILKVKERTPARPRYDVPSSTR